MWIKHSIKNRFLSKNTSKELANLLTFQLNCMQEDAGCYMYYSAELNKALHDCEKLSSVTDFIKDALDKSVSTELDELAAIICYNDEKISLKEAVNALELQVSLSRAAQTLRQTYWLFYKIGSIKL